MPEKLKLVSDNAAPVEPRKVRRAPKVSPYCPSCNSNTWFYVNQGRADYGKVGAVRVRCCVQCLSKGVMTTW